MGFTVETSIPVLAVLLQGILSFFSPCVLPLVPLYIGYLAGGTKTVDEHGAIHYSRKKVMINTLFFVVGVSFAFFLLGFGFTAAGRFFGGNRALFARIGGIIVILFGLYQLGVFGSSRILGQERRLPFQMDQLAMNPLLALVMGFTFSFAWTPCVGPALASVLLMASSANSATVGMLLIGVYTLGFVIPFLAVGLFTGSLLGVFKKYQKVVNYTVKAGGVLMILMGVMMWTGWMNGITGYLSQFGVGGAAPQQTTEAVADRTESTTETAAEASSQAETAAPQETERATETTKVVPAPEFTLTDQYGVEHTLSDYKGKTIFLNFWATWCGPCRKEMPDIEALYESYGGNKEDLIILGVANPKTKDYPQNQDGTVEEVTAFLEEGGYTYPVVMDTTGNIFRQYAVTAFPTTFMIDTEGNVYGYISGTLTREMMESIISQTTEGK